MSYRFDLVRLPPGVVNRDQAYRMVIAEQERLSTDGTADSIGPMDPAKERAKQKLAAALIARHPSLKLFPRNYARIATERRIDESEARRLYRHLELNDKQDSRSIQIIIFDDAAGASMSLAGSSSECREALRFLWDCLGILETEGGFSTADPQLDRLLDLSVDFATIVKSTCKAE